MNVLIFLAGVTGGYLTANLSAVFQWKPHSIFSMASAILILLGTFAILM